MPVENVTANRSYQLPNTANKLKDDVARLIAALTAIDIDVAAVIASLAAKAGLASPTFTGTPTAPTAASGTDSGQIATTAFVKVAVDLAIDGLLAGAPAALDTLAELAAALGDDDDYAATITNALAGKLAVDGSNVGANGSALRTALGVLAVDGANVGANGPALRTALGLSYVDAAAKAAFLGNIGVEAGAEGDHFYRGSDGLIKKLAKGAAGQQLRMKANGDPAPEWGSGITLNAVQSLTGSSVTFGSIPSWVRRVTVMFSGLSADGTAVPLFQLAHSGGTVTDGYTCNAGYIGHSQVTGLAAHTSGFGINSANSAANAYTGKAVFDLFDPATNTWKYTMQGTYDGSVFTIHGSGRIALPGALTQILLVTADAFDGGSGNHSWE